MKQQNGSSKFGNLVKFLSENTGNNYYKRIVNPFYNEFVLQCVDILTSNYDFDNVVVVTTEMPFEFCYYLSKICNVKLVGYNPMLIKSIDHFELLNNVKFYKRVTLIDPLDDIIEDGDLILFPDIECFYPLSLCNINFDNHVVAVMYKGNESDYDYFIPKNVVKKPSDLDDVMAPIKIQGEINSGNFFFAHGKK